MNDEYEDMLDGLEEAFMMPEFDEEKYQASVERDSHRVVYKEKYANINRGNKDKKEYTKEYLAVVHSYKSIDLSARKEFKRRVNEALKIGTPLNTLQCNLLMTLIITDKFVGATIKGRSSLAIPRVLRKDSYGTSLNIKMLEDYGLIKLVYEADIRDIGVLCNEYQLDREGSKFGCNYHYLTQVFRECQSNSQVQKVIKSLEPELAEGDLGIGMNPSRLLIDNSNLDGERMTRFDPVSVNEKWQKHFDSYGNKVTQGNYIRGMYASEHYMGDQFVLGELSDLAKMRINNQAIGVAVMLTMPRDELDVLGFNKYENDIKIIDRVMLKDSFNKSNGQYIPSYTGSISGRLYEKGSGVQGLSSIGKRFLYGDLIHYNYDLRASQISCMLQLACDNPHWRLDIDCLKEFVEDPSILEGYLIKLNIDKPTWKYCIYPLLFGSNPTYVRSEISKHLEKWNLEIFLQLPIVKEIREFQKVIVKHAMLQAKDGIINNKLVDLDLNLKDKKGKRIAKASTISAFYLQGLESYFIFSVMSKMEKKYLNSYEFDGIITVGKEIPQSIIDRVKLETGFHHAELELKDL